VNVEIKYTETVSQHLAKVAKGLATDGQMEYAVKKASRSFVSYIQKYYLRMTRGTHPIISDPNKQGSLASSIRPLFTYRSDTNEIIGGIMMTKNTASVYFSEDRASTTITPKPPNKYLAIPLSWFNEGDYKSPRQMPSPTGAWFTRKGNFVSGMKVKGFGMYPMFALKKSITLHRVADPKEIAKNYEPYFKGIITKTLRDILR